MSAPIRDRMQADLKVAMRERDAIAASVLRTTLSAVANAEAVELPARITDTEVERKHLTEDDIRVVVRGEQDDLETTAAQLRRLGKLDDADALIAKAAVLEGYLG